MNKYQYALAPFFLASTPIIWGALKGGDPTQISLAQILFCGALLGVSLIIISMINIVNIGADYHIQKDFNAVTSGVYKVNYSLRTKLILLRCLLYLSIAFTLFCIIRLVGV